MSSPFEAGAQFYDLLYRDKDYQGEADYIATLIKRFIDRPPANIRLLDLGCGTGRHALLLKEMGFDVEGSDGSKEMVELAEKAAMSRKQAVIFHNQSFQNSYELPGPYDAVISMFAAVNYLTEPDGLKLTLENVNKILQPGGIFAFDFWHGSAVIEDYEPVRVLRKKLDDKELLRIANTTLDKNKNSATVTYTCMYFENNVRKIEFEEVHSLRYFFLPEVLKALQATGFELLYSSPFKKLDMSLGERDWYASLVVRKK